jgi:antitoxin component of MazEF toxin-antitoxin module
MKLSVRRIGNSLGIIIPRAVLRSWGIEEGDSLEISGSAIRPPAPMDRGHAALDEHKRRLAAAVASRFPPALIRAHGLGNLHRWKKSGAWSAAYEEWENILTRGSDGELFAAMLGPDEHANQLRQSPPYVGLLPRDVVRRLNEEAAG